MTDLTIVIPVLNEGKNLIETIDKLENEIHVPHTINIVYDNDNDTTIPLVESIIGNYSTSINLMKNEFGNGVLNAIKTGMKNTKSQFVVAITSTLTNPPSVINEMLAKAWSENADIVCASRYIQGGKQIGGALPQKIASRIAAISLNHGAKIGTTDATNSFKMFRTSFLDTQTIESSDGFEFGLELLVKAKALGKKICEVPTKTNQSHSKFHPISAKDKHLPAYLKWYLKAFKKENK